jgi:signal transduction histidine kinase
VTLAVTRMIARLQQLVAGRVWLIFALAVAIAVPTVVLGEIAANDTRQRVREGQLRTQSAGIERVASRVTVIIASYAEVLAAAVKPIQIANGSRDAAIVTAARTDNVAAANEALQEMVTRFPYNGTVYLVDARGIVVAGIQNGNLGTQTIEVIGSSRDHLPFVDTPRSRLGALFMTPDELARAFAGPAVYLSDLYEPFDRGGQLMSEGSMTTNVRPGEWRGVRATVAVRILGTDGRLAGVLAADMNNIPFTDAVFEIRGAADEAYIVDRNGRFMHRLQIGPYDRDTFRDLSSTATVRTLLDGGSLRGEAEDPLGGGVRLVTSARSPNVAGTVGQDLTTGWLVLALQPLDPIFASLDRDLALLRALRLSLVAALLGFAALLTFAMRRTVRQRAALAEANASLSQATRELTAASGHKSEFLANMSHELRTPLNAVIGFSEVLEQRMVGELNEKQIEYVRDISSSGKHLLDLVNEILDLSKVEAGRMELELSEFTLAETIHGALAFVRERAARHGIEIASDIAPDLGTVTADERKIRQVLLNLLSNAVKFTPDNGWIGITAHRADSEVRMSVKDTGIGIAPEDQAKVFEEIQQVGTSSDRSREGTGLGLTLAKRFVELHGGRIWIESELTKGTTFTFELPSRAVAAVPVA